MLSFAAKISILRVIYISACARPFSSTAGDIASAPYLPAICYREIASIISATPSRWQSRQCD